jgi:hypothetical protein
MSLERPNGFQGSFFWALESRLFSWYNQNMPAMLRAANLTG